MTVLDGRSLSSWTPDQTSREHALVVAGHAHRSSAAAASSSAAISTGGGSALLALGPDIDPADARRAAGACRRRSRRRRRARAERRHAGAGRPPAPDVPPVRDARGGPGDVRFERAGRVGDEGRRVLARFSGGPAALARAASANGRLLIFSSDLDNKLESLPVEPGIRAVRRRIRSLPHQRSGRSRRPGCFPTTPAGVEARPGVHRCRARADAPDRRVAVNVNMEESNPAPISPDEFLAAVPTNPADDPAGRGGGGAESRGQPAVVADRPGGDVPGAGGRRTGGPPRDVIGIGSRLGAGSAISRTGMGRGQGQLMSERQNELGAVLAEVRRRWPRRVRLSAWAVGTVAATMLLGVGGLTVWLLASEGCPWRLSPCSCSPPSRSSLLCAVVATCQRRPPTCSWRGFVEERARRASTMSSSRPRQHARLVGGVGHPRSHASGGPGRRGRRRTNASSAPTRCAAAASRRRGRHARRWSPAARLFARPIGAGGRASPRRTCCRRASPIEVEPGTPGCAPGSRSRSAPGSRGARGGHRARRWSPAADEAAKTVRMAAASDGTFAVTFDDVQASFVYPRRGRRRAVRRLRGHGDRPARGRAHRPALPVPEGLGLPPRVEDDGGDIYGPAGTDGRLHDRHRPAGEAGALTLADGSQRRALGDGRRARGSLPIGADGAYRVALADDDGLENPGDTEYFIRDALDRPPDVRVLRPGGDKQVTPLEEVADRSPRRRRLRRSTALDLVFQKPGDPETVVPLPGPARRADRQRQVPAVSSRTSGCGPATSSPTSCAPATSAAASRVAKRAATCSSSR